MGVLATIILPTCNHTVVPAPRPNIILISRKSLPRYGGLATLRPTKELYQELID